MNKDSQPICQIDQFGTKRWFLNGELHRLDGPAIESILGDEYWFLHGQYHRLDGPAVTYASGYKLWYYHGKCIDCYCQKDFERLIKILFLL